MPGGKASVNPSPTDLQNWLSRKRFPLDQWLLSQNILTPNGLIALLADPDWYVSPTLAETISELLKPIPAPATPVLETEVEASSLSPVSVEPTVAVEDEAITPPEEVAQQPEEEEIAIPVFSTTGKERKKNRFEK